MDALRPHKELGIDVGSYLGALGLVAAILAAVAWKEARVAVAPYAHFGLVLSLAGISGLFLRAALLRVAAQYDDLFLSQVSHLQKALYWGSLVALSLSLPFGFGAFFASIRNSAPILAIYGVLSLLGPVLAFEIHRRTKRKSRHG
jgi:hypothetical protein